jgi:PAS domain S-box-containing protein
MVRLVTQWIAPPVFVGDREKTRQAALLNAALLTLLMLMPLVMAGSLLGGRMPAAVYGVDLFMMGVCLLLRAQMRRGGVVQASGWLLVLGTVAITTVLARLGTIRAPAAAMYLQLIITAGLLTGLFGMIATIAACTFAVAGLIAAGNAGLLPAPDLSVGATQGITYAVAFAWTGGLMYAAIRELRGAIVEAEAELAGRQRAEGELARHLAQLEETVKARTAELTLVNERLRAEIDVREKIQGALRESEQKFSLAFKSSPDTIILTRLADGVIIEVNDGFSTMSGFDRSEAVGRTTLDLNLWLDAAGRERAVAALGTSGVIRGIELHFRRKSGEVFTGLFSAAIFRLGDETCSLSTIQDITARKTLEHERERLIEELRDSLAKVRTLAGIIPICMHCRKIRDDSGYWSRLEQFIHDHTEAEFSHGICPDCLAKHHPEDA